MFEQYSMQRAGFADELGGAVRRLGSEPAEPSGVLGALHHGWIALKGVLTGHSEHQILEETERGEDMSLKNYREALSQQLPAQLRSLLERQYKEVELAHSRITSLRDQTAKGQTAAR